jgi:hypothetical protein
MSFADLPTALQLNLEETVRGLFQLEAKRYRDFIGSSILTPFRTASPQERVHTLELILKERFSYFVSWLPLLPTNPTPLSASLFDVIPHVANAVWTLAAPHLFAQADLLPAVVHQLNANYRTASLTQLSETAIANGGLVSPPEFIGSPHLIAETYLKNTPFLKILQTPVPFAVPSSLRPQGTHIVAPPGRGKTTLMRALLAHDLNKIGRGEASIIVIDAKDHPTESLIGPLRRVSLFAPGQPLHDRITIIDPHPEFPPALNPFDIGTNADVPEDEREAFRSHTLDFLEHTFGGMFEFGFTPTQSICFIKAVDVVLSLSPSLTFRHCGTCSMTEVSSTWDI